MKERIWREALELLEWLANRTTRGGENGVCVAVFCMVLLIGAVKWFKWSLIGLGDVLVGSVCLVSLIF